MLWLTTCKAKNLIGEIFVVLEKENNSLISLYLVEEVSSNLLTDNSHTLVIYK